MAKTRKVNNPFGWARPSAAQAHKPIMANIAMKQAFLAARLQSTMKMTHTTGTIAKESILLTRGPLRKKYQGNALKHGVMMDPTTIVSRSLR